MEIIVEQITELPLKIGVVAKGNEIINKTAKKSFCVNPTEADLKNAINKTTQLMRRRQRFDCGDEQQNLNLKDVTYKMEMIEFGLENERVSVSRYKEMIQQFADQNPIFKKIKSGREISEEESKELAELINEIAPIMTEELLQRAYGIQHVKFLQFIKHILQIEVVDSFEETVR